MTTRARHADQVVVTPQMLAAMRQGEADGEWLAQHPEVLEPFRGEWVAVHGGRIVAHSPDGREVALQANTSRYPGALLEYVPTREEADALHIYTPFVGASGEDDNSPHNRIMVQSH
jgi:hypothetical protein